MVRRWILLTAIFAIFSVALAGCAGTPFSRGYYAGGYPYRVSGYYCGEWRVGRGHRVSIHRAAIKPKRQPLRPLLGSCSRSWCDHSHGVL
jgi:hypothetical protein